MVPKYGFSIIIDVSGTGVTAQELYVALVKRKYAVYAVDGLGDMGVTDYIHHNISRPGMWAVELFREALPKAIAEFRTGIHAELAAKFMEGTGTE